MPDKPDIAASFWSVGTLATIPEENPCTRCDVSLLFPRLRALRTVTVDSSYGFSTAVTMPTSTPAGEHALYVTVNGDPVVTLPIVVSAAPVDDDDDSDDNADGDDTGGLADTGPSEDAALIALIASMLLAAGIGTRALGIRRR